MIKNHFMFDPIKKPETNWNFHRLSDATFYDRINTICQFIKLFLDKMSKFEEYGAFKYMNFNKA